MYTMDRVPVSTWEKYFREQVQMKREMTKKAIAKVGPILDQLTAEMNRLDKRIPRKLEGDARVGSYYAGLKIKRADEFDFSVPIQADWGKMVWTGEEDRYFQLTPNVDQKFETLPDQVRVVQSNTPLPQPETGYMSVQHHTVASDWAKRDKLQLTFNGYIIPFMVKLRFKAVLKKAIDNLGLHVKEGI